MLNKNLGTILTKMFEYWFNIFLVKDNNKQSKAATRSTFSIGDAGKRSNKISQCICHWYLNKIS